MANKPQVTGRAKGGMARAKLLTPKERKDIASRAAASRWATDDLPTAICSSGDTPLMIGGQPIDCYVLEDGTRVLSQGGLLVAMGRSRRTNSRQAEAPAMFRGAAFEQFLTPEILVSAQPLPFRTSSGHRASGYRAEFLPQVCEIYLKARDAGRLARNQMHMAVQADILMRGLALTGIIALVDEATHYQDYRTRNALAQILEQFVAKEMQVWVKTFPDDFYSNLFRLRQLEYDSASVKRPQYFGQLTNDIIYSRLAPGVLDELKRVTLRDEEGRPKHRYFQRLTSNQGYPQLREHLGSVVTLMKISDTWQQFTGHLDKLHPRLNTNLPLPLDWEDGKGL